MAKQQHEPFADVTLPGEFPMQEVADHEVFLSFRNDEDAIFWREWWASEGAVAFGKWLKKRPVSEQ